MLASVAGIGFTVTTPKAQAQVSVAIGVAPDCPYGYYDTTPYGCAPTGYYGPEWFNGDGFIGAGPWFHGAGDFQGNVNNRSIRTTVIRGRRLNAVRKPNRQSALTAPTSKVTKRGMDVATFPRANASLAFGALVHATFSRVHFTRMKSRVPR